MNRKELSSTDMYVIFENISLFNKIAHDEGIKNL